MTNKIPFNPPEMPFKYTGEEAQVIANYVNIYNRYEEVRFHLIDNGLYLSLSEERQVELVHHVTVCLINHLDQTEDYQYFYDEELPLILGEFMREL